MYEEVLEKLEEYANDVTELLEKYENFLKAEGFNPPVYDIGVNLSPEERSRIKYRFPKKFIRRFNKNGDIARDYNLERLCKYWNADKQKRCNIKVFDIYYHIQYTDLLWWFVNRWDFYGTLEVMLRRHRIILAASVFEAITSLIVETLLETCSCGLDSTSTGRCRKSLLLYGLEKTKTRDIKKDLEKKVKLLSQIWLKYAGKECVSSFNMNLLGQVMLKYIDFCGQSKGDSQDVGKQYDNKIHKMKEFLEKGNSFFGDHNAVRIDYVLEGWLLTVKNFRNYVHIYNYEFLDTAAKKRIKEIWAMVDYLAFQYLHLLKNTVLSEIDNVIPKLKEDCGKCCQGKD